MRHGQSEWNAVGRWQGWADPPLSELGRQQSRLAGKRLHEVDVAVSSDLVRAIDTATLMIEALGIAPAAVEPRLRERDVGEWTGLSRDQINRRWPEALSTMSDPPGGETTLALQTRVVSAVTDLARAYPDASVLAVSHGGAIRSLERHLGVEPHPLPNLGGTWLEVSPEGTMAVGPRVLLVDPEQVAVTVPRQL